LGFNFNRLVKNIDQLGLEEKDHMDASTKKMMMEMDKTGGKSFEETSPKLKSKVSFDPVTK
jgi:hypothetical protein